MYVVREIFWVYESFGLLKVTKLTGNNQMVYWYLFVAL